MESYNTIRQQYKPKHIKLLIIAESPPPAADVDGSRHFYRTDRIRTDDRLFINTIRAIYPETLEIAAAQLEKDKKNWLQRLQSEGFYMIEALEDSLPHEVTKPERQALIAKHLLSLLERVKAIADTSTKIILVKSNVFDVAAEPLRQEGFEVLNTELVDYPGRFNQRSYREKLAILLAKV